MRTETELNEALAKWAGFQTNLPVTEARYPSTWLDPEGGYADEPPDFCHSVDACLKWLAPKFSVKGLRYFYNLSEANKWDWIWEVRLILQPTDAPWREYVAWNPDLAPAFARAAEQAMDAEKGK